MPHSSSGRTPASQAENRGSIPLCGTMKAPWTPEQIASLNDFQDSGCFHPYTCFDGHDLVATESGWTCPACEAEGKKYHQDWCMDFMANGEWRKSAAEMGMFYADPKVQKLLDVAEKINEQMD